MAPLYFESIQKGKLDAYDYYTGEKLTREDIEKSKKMKSPDEIGMLRFNEKWLFNKQKYIMQKIIYSIVLGYDVYNEDGDIKGYKPVFKIYLNEVQAKNDY